MHKIIITKTVKKFLSKHPDIAPRFFQYAERIAQNPFASNLPVKKIIGHE